MICLDLHELIKSCHLFSLLFHELLCKFLDLEQDTLLFLVVLAKNMIIQDSALVLLLAKRHDGVDLITCASQVRCSPEIKLCVFEQLVAVWLQPHLFRLLRGALIIIDNFVKFLLQFKTSGIHLDNIFY